MAKNNSIKTATRAGIGLAALAAAAAGTYYFYGSKNASKHRKNLKSWAVKARGEVMERVEQLKDVSQAGYQQAVKQVIDKYKKIKNIDPAELTALAAELKGTWNKIASQLKGRSKTTKKVRVKRVR